MPSFTCRGGIITEITVLELTVEVKTVDTQMTYTGHKNACAILAMFTFDSNFIVDLCTEHFQNSYSGPYLKLFAYATTMKCLTS